MEAWLDDGLKELLEQLKQRSLFDNTMFVFVIDNGWCNGEVSKGSPFEKGVQTPIFVTWSGTLPAKQRRECLISTHDIYPTILEYAGVPVPDTASGRSLRPLIEGDLSNARNTLFGAVYPAFATQHDNRPERDIYAPTRELTTGSTSITCRTCGEYEIKSTFVFNRS
jgi:arylsulfatase A-like enzyme